MGTSTRYFFRKNQAMDKDRIKHPSHYTDGIEMWDYAYSHGMDFFEGNILKYVTRWRHKNGLEDLYKAKQYLDRLIEHTENKTSK